VPLPASVLRRALDPKAAWVELPGRYLPTDVAPLVAIRGVHSAPVVERVYASAAGTRYVVGRTDATGGALDGLELALDGVLRGERGSAEVLRDARGRLFESPSVGLVEPRPGHTVSLTLNHGLQDITERALGDAIRETRASGGDIVVLDPHSGEILAMNSRRDFGRSAASSALTEPFEPGSTLKPLVVARLLDLGRARPEDVVPTHDGTWTIDGRRIRDSHAAASMTLADVIRFSSNIGMVQFALRLSPAEQYQALRDFGFGMPTGIPYPSEATGILRPPQRWSRTSAASLAMGYELAVTPVQLAAAFGSIANGGLLLEPALVKQVRTPEGTVTWQHERRVVRRVMTPATAAVLRTMLTSVVDSGTATNATLSLYDVGGKTGTARRTAGGRGYEAGSYTASFVGLFPAQSPQFVILIKLDNPKGTSYYGGLTAAPVSKAVVESALAARDAALDRGALARQAARRRPAEPAPGTAPVLAAAAETLSAPSPEPVEPEPLVDSEPYVVKLPAGPRSAERDLAPRPVPDVADLPLRAAVRRLHAAGFRVALASSPSPRTLPAAGTPLPGGSLVRLYHRP
jgi:cell division protein FtsI (penicillin-binding protein 3)